jgi:hypothetical protein
MDDKLRLSIWKKSFIVRQKNIKLCNFMINQIGGGKQLKIQYNDNTYIFEEVMDKDHYILYSKDEFECVIIIIGKNDKVAEIHGIGNNKLCLKETNTNIGSTLLKITLKMLEKYQTKLKINKILLTDNSLKKCNNENIKLSIMLTLLTGDTWYGNFFGCCPNNTKKSCPRNKNPNDFCSYDKYGFRPYDDTLIQYYENNKKIMNTITLKDINLIKYLEMTSLDKNIIEKTKKFINKHQIMLVKDYLSRFLKEYDKTCKYFYNFYFTLFIDLRLYDFHHRVFVKYFD